MRIYIFFYPPNFINTYSKTSPHTTSYLRFIQQSENQNSQTTSQNEQFRRRFSLRPTTLGLTSSHLSCHLFTKYAPRPLHSLNNHYQPSPIPAPSRKNNRRSKSIQPSYPYFLTPQTTILHILKRKTKIKAPDIENGHTATASRIILKNEKHVPRVSYSYIDIYVGKKPRPSPIMRKKT